MANHSNSSSRVEKKSKSGLIAQLFGGLFDMLFPRLCMCCGEPLEELEHTICTHCRLDMPLTNFALRENNAMVEMMAGRVDFKRASALMFFRKGSHYQTLLHRMKYRGRDDIARVLGEMYGLQLLQSGYYDDIDYVVPVPLHWTKRAKRGYNQSEEFAKGIARSLGITVIGDLLVRIKVTKTQARLKGKENRAKNVDGAFKLRAKRGNIIDGKVVLLVDDIITTGATLEACAEVLNRELPGVRLNLGAIAIVAQS